MQSNSRAPRAASLVAAGVAALSSAALPAQTATGTGGAAAEPSAESAGIQEVVVTARRRTENLQDVPLAVTAISADTLLQQNVTNLEDLNSFAPNLKISADRATNATINVY